VAEGVRIEYAEEVYRITPTASGRGISLLCPTRKIMTRGDTLNLSTLSIVSCDLESRSGLVLISRWPGHRSGLRRRYLGRDHSLAGRRPPWSLFRSLPGRTARGGRDHREK
jgi:hypothetical protein